MNCRHHIAFEMNCRPEGRFSHSCSTTSKHNPSASIHRPLRCEREQLVNYTFWSSDNTICAKLTLRFRLLVVSYSPFQRPLTFMQPPCFCELELMPGAVPWMPCCLWWECSTSRRPHSCSQAQLITTSGIEDSSWVNITKWWLFMCECVCLRSDLPFYIHGTTQTQDLWVFSTKCLIYQGINKWVLCLSGEKHILNVFDQDHGGSFVHANKSELNC